MFYKRVCIEGFGYSLPKEAISSRQIEHRLAPLYERLKLPEGRLELMSGIRERRFWPEGTRITVPSAASCEMLLAATRFDRHKIGALVHGSVCRDFLEPATACGVHARLHLTGECIIYDISNACLGILNGIVQVANMIELGQIEAGLIVGTENSRALVERTIQELNQNTGLTRASIKESIASLTIGSASVAVLLCDRDLSRSGSRLLSARWHANTSEHELCQSDGLETFMRTDSQRLLREGIATGLATFTRFLDELDWTRSDIQKTFCHQVGIAHQKLLFETLGLDPAIDFTTLEYLGNTGAAALPVTTALGIEQGHVLPADRVALLGIGSGINCLMLATESLESAVVAGSGL
ncbi:MAG: 3-oxoacyl-ACP synthase III [Pirellulales bacterium]|nr:3-oxoacyl-ACP synthase III [Pirellulales bacterium]